MESADYILCECDLDVLEAFVEDTEKHYCVKLARQPSICTVMLKAQDSVEFQPFYLGEALATECMLVVNGKAGYGLCIGDEPVRCYCIAFVDALLSIADERLALLHTFLAQQNESIASRLRVEYNLIQKTKVDFKLLEED